MTKKQMVEFQKALDTLDWEGMAKAHQEQQEQWHANEWKEFIQGIEGRAQEKIAILVEDMFYKDHPLAKKIRAMKE